MELDEEPKERRSAPVGLANRAIFGLVLKNLELI